MTPKQILCFTGGRDRDDADARAIVERELATLGPADLVIVGDCPTGVDRYVVDFIRIALVPCQAIVFCATTPAAHLDGFTCRQVSDWQRDGKRAGPMRNEAMLRWLVDTCQTLGCSGRVVAIPGAGPGTLNTIDLARSLGAPIEVHEKRSGPEWPPEIQSLLDAGIFMLSASSYKLAKRCLRRWAYKEICKKREPGTTSQDFGTRGHEQAEAFLRDGIAPDIHTPEGRLVYESLPHLPRPGEAQVEVPFAFEIDGAWFDGRIDVVHVAEQRKLDHKFVASIDYAETPKTLPLDPAAVLYTLAPPVWPVTRLRWIYNLKRKRKDQQASNPVDAELSIVDASAYARKHLVPAWQLLDGIRTLFAGQSPDEALPLLDSVPCSPRDCMAFNRPCPHMAYCSLENTGDLESING